MMATMPFRQAQSRCRNRRCGSTGDATDRTDAQWGAHAPLVITLLSAVGRPTDIALRFTHRAARQWRMRPMHVPPGRCVQPSLYDIVMGAVSTSRCSI